MSDTTNGAGPGRLQAHDLRVLRVVRETADASSIVFEVPAPLAAAFAYRAGQFLTLHVPVEGRTLHRCYSLASSPDTDREHKVTVKRVADGRASNWINDHVKAGDTMKVMAPAGQFTLGAGDGDVVLFAGGSGITPVISILKSALAASSRRVRLLYANRDEASTIFREELAALAARHGERVEVQHHLDVRDGFVDAAAVRRTMAGREGAECFICGPGPFMDTVEAALAAAGVDAGRIHIERFTAATDDDEAAADPAAATRRVSMVLDGAARVLEVREGETVLHAAKRAGIEPPSSCESGFCGCCMARLKRGRVRMLVNDFLSEAEVAEGWVLTCQAVAESDDCEVEYPD